MLLRAGIIRHTQASGTFHIQHQSLDQTSKFICTMVSHAICFRKIQRRWLSNLSFFSKRRNCSGAEQGSTPSPAEAGKLAYSHRLKRDVKNCNTIGMDTILSHAGLHSPSSNTIGSLNEPLSPPIHLESTYTRPPSGDYFKEEDGGRGWIYSRIGNPTRKLLEETITHLELAGSGERKEDHSLAVTCAFSSGMAAVSSIVLALPQNLHIILPDDIYHGVPTQLKAMFVQRGVTYSATNMTNIQDIEKEIKSSKVNNVLVWMETPSNPGCKVVDIDAVCKLVSICRNDNTNITTAVDSTWAPPNLTQPLLLGADVVMHSGTKYFGGHSDVLLGCTTTSPFTLVGKELGDSIRTIQTTLGSTASPFDCWLTLRGLRTLHLRVERQCQTAMKIATFLSSHKFVEKVHYPGLVSHPQHEIASRQMNGGYGGMLSFEMKDEATAMAVAGAVSTIKRATSLGGTETLIEHRASIEPLDGRVSPDGLLRVSVGLENANDLTRDLEIAIDIANEIVGC